MALGSIELTVGLVSIIMEWVWVLQCLLGVGVTLYWGGFSFHSAGSGTGSGFHSTGHRFGLFRAVVGVGSVALGKLKVTGQTFISETKGK